MEFTKSLCLLLVLLTIVSSSQAYKFYVGGNAGWVPNPSENYNEWAGRNRFQINDTLVFKYKKGSDSVLEVNKEDYDKCNKTNPIKKFEEGDTEFKLERSGPFYFISGYDQNCEKGQKLIVVVLAPRGQSHTPPLPSPKSPSPSSSPKSSPPKSSPSSSPSPSLSPSHQPSGSPPVPEPTPSSNPPSPSPAVSSVPARGPQEPSPAGSPGPVGESPALSPAPTEKSPSPSPVGSPGPIGGPPTPSTATPSSPAGTSPSAGSPPSSPGGAGTPSSSNETAPPPSHAWPADPSGFLVFSVTIVVGAVLLR